MIARTLLPACLLLLAGAGVARAVRDGTSEGAAAPSCAHIALVAPMAADGARWIDPDGAGDVAAFQTWCTADGWTLVHKTDASSGADRTNDGFNVAALAASGEADGVAVLPRDALDALSDDGRAWFRAEAAADDAAAPGASIEWLGALYYTATPHADHRPTYVTVDTAADEWQGVDRGAWENLGGHGTCVHAGQSTTTSDFFCGAHSNDGLLFATNSASGAWQNQVDRAGSKGTVWVRHDRAGWRVHADVKGYKHAVSAHVSSNTFHIYNSVMVDGVSQLWDTTTVGAEIEECATYASGPGDLGDDFKLAVRMGRYYDFYAPKAGQSLCQIVSAGTQHDWLGKSADNSPIAFTSWKVHHSRSDDLILGGMSPVGDPRDYLPFYGIGTYDTPASHGLGCCSESTATVSGGNWNLPYTGYIRADDSNLTPTLSAPAGGAAVNGDEVAVSFTLPEDAAAASVVFRNTDGGAETVVSLGALAAGAHAITVNADDLAATAGATGASEAALASATYDVRVRYENEWAYAHESTAASGVAFTAVPACAAAGQPAAPLLQVGTSGIEDGDLVAVWEASDRYTGAVSFSFSRAGATPCDGGATAGVWTREEDVVSDCVDRYTLRVPVTQALNECGFSAEPEDGGSVWYYEAVVEATTQEPGEDVFGQPTTETVTTAFRVRVELPKSVDVSASAVAYGNVIQFALLSQQEVDTSTPTAAFKWTLVTSVQYPYELTAKEVTEETAHDFESLGLSLSAASVACPASGACTQTFEIAATESTSCELTDAELKSVFTIGCRSQFTGACDTPEGVETDTATFTVSTDSFCARVVEVATVTPTLTTSTSQGGASAADFVLQTTLFGRVTFAIEAGLSVTETRLLSLDLVSEESVKPVTGAGVQDSAVVSAISFVESDQDGTAPHLDFQFQLNTDSVKFAVGGGQASLTITAVVEVTYDGAGSQRFEVQAVSGPGSVSTAASSTVGVSTPAAGGSSTAGSTVLGVSTGTAMVAGVGLIAVVALAAGAAVVARKRRSSASPKAVRHSSSSASIQLDIAPAGAATTPVIATADLANVQAAYVASQ